MQQLIAKNCILWPSKTTGRPRLKRFLSEIIDKTTGFSTVLNPGFTTDGTREVTNLLDFKAFDFPKPTLLVKLLLEQLTDPYENQVILDFFSGSCTTANAVLDLNSQDGGTRKFIMVQLPEPCDEGSGTFNTGYENIADIGKERIRRVIKNIESKHADTIKVKECSLPGMTEGPPMIDLGFKVFKLDRSNFKIWDGSRPDASEEELIRQLTLHIDHIDPHASQEDILYELLLKAGFMLTEKVQKLEMAGKTVYSAAEGALLICLEDKITPEMIDAVAAAEPMQFLCLDKGFQGNDQLKANAVQTFNALNQGRDKTEQIVFRTV